MKIIRGHRVVAVVLVAALCEGRGHGQSPATIVSTSVRPTAAPTGDSKANPGSYPVAATSQYTLGPADVVKVSVWKNSDLSQTVTVGPDGFVSLPLLGEVHAAGMTANQLAKLVTSRLSTYVVGVQVTVSIVDIRSRQVYVMGQVGKPGGYPLVAPLTVLQLIAQAGGLSTYAKRKDIFVLRANEGSSERLSFNYVHAIHGDSKQNINLQPGDTVIVP